MDLRRQKLLKEWSTWETLLWPRAANELLGRWENFQVGCSWKSLLGKMRFREHREAMGLLSQGVNGKRAEPCIL